MASPAATRAFVKRAIDAGVLHPSHARTCGGLATTSIGFGAYRIGGSLRTYEALEKALTSGAINLVETSSHYGAKYPGESEEMIGACLRGGGGESFGASGGASGGRRRNIDRSEVVLVTKLGHLTVPAEVLDSGGYDEFEVELGYKNIVRDRSVAGGAAAASRGAGGSAASKSDAPRDWCTTSPGGGGGGAAAAAPETNASSSAPAQPLTEAEEVASRSKSALEKTWHCLEPDFLLDEFDASVRRLGTDPDFVLLHNPEFYLASLSGGAAGDNDKNKDIAESWSELYRRMEIAFATLEALRASGRIRGYGVSGNFLSCYHSVSGRRNAFEALSLQNCLGGAIDAAARKADSPSKGECGEGGGFFQNTGFIGMQAPLNPLEGGALLGRKNVVPGFDGEADLKVVERNDLTFFANRPLAAIAPAGMSVRAHDWAHADSSANFVDKNMPLQRLLGQVVREHLAGETPGTTGSSMYESDDSKLQQLVLLAATSASQRGIVLNGMRRSDYVDDALGVLKKPAMAVETVVSLYKRVQELAEELGGDASGLWK